MTAVSSAFASTKPRQGLVIGVVPGHKDAEGIPSPPDGYPNPYVELAIRTHLPHSGERGEDDLSRNHINILTADVVVALPGSSGTASEVRLAAKYGKPIICFVRREDKSEQNAHFNLEGVVVVAHDFEEVKAFVLKHA